jgi:hypothetical protein
MLFLMFVNNISNHGHESLNSYKGLDLFLNAIRRSDGTAMHSEPQKKKAAGIKILYTIVPRPKAAELSLSM